MQVLAVRNISKEAVQRRPGWPLFSYPTRINKLFIMFRQHTARPVFLAFRSSTPFITTVISYAVFTEQFLYAVIIPVAPFALHQRVHIPDGRVQYWVALLIAIYGIASGLSSGESIQIGPAVWSAEANGRTAPWGWWSDRSQSRRTPFLVGLSTLLGSTILLWLARKTAVLVLGRILQGISTTVIWTTGLAIMVDTVGEARIGEYMGYIAIALNMGTLFAPMLGGVVFARAGYNAVFAMAVAVVGVDVVLRLVMIERSDAAQWGPSATVLTDEESAGADRSAVAIKETKRPEVEITALSPSASCDTLPIAVKHRRSKEPSKWRLPPVVTLLFSCCFLSALWGVVVQATIYSAFQTVLPLALHHTFGWKSTGGGLMFLPLIVPSLLGPIVGMVSDRVGPRWLATAGLLGLCPSMILLRLVDRDDLAHKVLLCCLLALVGCCIALTLEPLMAEITYLGGKHDVSRENGTTDKVGSYAQAYALFNLAWSAGDTVGPLWAGLVIDASGWKTMTLSLGLLGGLSAIPTVLWCGGWLFDKRNDS